MLRRAIVRASSTSALLVLFTALLDGCPPPVGACAKNNDCPSGEQCVQAADGSLSCAVAEGEGAASEGEGVGEGEGEGVVGEGEGAVVGEGEGAVGEGEGGEGEGEGGGPLRHVPGAFVSTASTTT